MKLAAERKRSTSQPQLLEFPATRRPFLCSCAFSMPSTCLSKGRACLLWQPVAFKLMVNCPESNVINAYGLGEVLWHQQGTPYGSWLMLSTDFTQREVYCVHNVCEYCEVAYSRCSGAVGGLLLQHVRHTKSSSSFAIMLRVLLAAKFH